MAMGDPQTGSTLTTVASNPVRSVVASVKNLTHRKLDDVVIGSGTVVPQYRPIIGE